MTPYPPGVLLNPNLHLDVSVIPEDNYYVQSWSDSCTAAPTGTVTQTGAIGKKVCSLTMSDDRTTCPTVRAEN